MDLMLRGLRSLKASPVKMKAIAILISIFAPSAHSVDFCNVSAQTSGHTCPTTAANVTCCCSGQCTEDTYEAPQPRFRQSAANVQRGVYFRYDSVIKIGENLWTVLTYNVPELANAGPGTNRMAIFKVPALGAYDTPSLVLVNGVNLCNSTLDGLLALETNEGAPVR